MIDELINKTYFKENSVEVIRVAEFSRGLDSMVTLQQIAKFLSQISKGVNLVLFSTNHDPQNIP